MAKPGEGAWVTITELEGDRRVLSFAGPTLPKQGVDAGVKQRSVSTQYPGSSQKSTQLLGTNEDDIVLEGMLRDRQIGQSGAALVAATLMRSLCTSMRYCQLEWGETIVRRGYVKEVAPTFDREDIIRYRIVFEVSETDEADVLVKQFEPVDTSQTLLAKLLQALTAAESLAKSAILLNNVGRAVL